MSSDASSPHPTNIAGLVGPHLHRLCSRCRPRTRPSRFDTRIRPSETRRSLPCRGCSNPTGNRRRRGSQPQDIGSPRRFLRSDKSRALHSPRRACTRRTCNAGTNARPCKRRTRTECTDRCDLRCSLRRFDIAVCRFRRLRTDRTADSRRTPRTRGAARVRARTLPAQSCRRERHRRSRSGPRRCARPPNGKRPKTARPTRPHATACETPGSDAFDSCVGLCRAERRLGELASAVRASPSSRSGCQVATGSSCVHRAPFAANSSAWPPCLSEAGPPRRSIGESKCRAVR